jgi:hypothetical protein
VDFALYRRHFYFSLLCCFFLGFGKAEDVIDARIMRKLDEFGFIDRAYAGQGIPLK